MTSLTTWHLLEPILDLEAVEDSLESPGHLLCFVWIDGIDGGEDGSEDKEEYIAGSEREMEGKVKESDGDQDKAYKPLVMRFLVGLRRWRWWGGLREDVGYGRSIKLRWLRVGR